MRCRKCGREVHPEDRFCPNCGSRIDAQDSVEQVSQEENRISDQDNHPQSLSEQEPDVPGRKKKSGLMIAVICVAAILVCVAVFLYFRGNNKPFGNITEQQVEIGDTVEFGSYEQDNKDSNGKEPIEWYVLGKEDGRVLLVSKYCLDCMPYDADNGKGNWESSDIRAWLNDGFMNDAFAKKEKEMLLSGTVENPGIYAGTDREGGWIITNSEDQVDTVMFHSDGSVTTEDTVYLLSADEAITYLGSGMIEAPQLTEYAKEEFLDSIITQAAINSGTDEDTIRKLYSEMEEKFGNGCCHWWLRSPGFSDDSASVVSYGSAGIQAQSVTEMAAVRPVLWIKTN